MKNIIILFLLLVLSSRCTNNLQNRILSKKELNYISGSYSTDTINGLYNLFYLKYFKNASRLLYNQKVMKYDKKTKKSNVYDLMDGELSTKLDINSISSSEIYFIDDCSRQFCKFYINLSPAEENKTSNITSIDFVNSFNDENQKLIHSSELYKLSNTVDLYPLLLHSISVKNSQFADSLLKKSYYDISYNSNERSLKQIGSFSVSELYMGVSRLAFTEGSVSVRTVDRAMGYVERTFTRHGKLENFTYTEGKIKADWIPHTPDDRLTSKELYYEVYIDSTNKIAANIIPKIGYYPRYETFLYVYDDTFVKEIFDKIEIELKK